METLLTRPRSIPPDTGAVIKAIILGGVQIAMKKDGMIHEVLGRRWGALILFITFSSFFIHEIVLWGIMARFIYLACCPFFALTWMPIPHGLEILKDTNCRCHLYRVVLVIAGFFTLLPGRAINQAG